MSIYKIKKENMESISPLFAGWQESLIWSCLQGCMGEAWADSQDNPRSAQIVLADFCYFAGEVNRELIAHKPETRESDFIIMVPSEQGCEEWAREIEAVYGSECKRVERYAIKKEPGIFDRDKLMTIVEGLSPEYECKLIDQEFFRQTREHAWSKDFTFQYRDYEEYLRSGGLGAAVLYQGELVAGASSYTVYREGIEIEIGTREDHRRRGLASVCGARLILECIERGLYPSWDAQNKWSVGLAEKLGYHFDRAYPAYEVYAFGKKPSGI